MRPLSGLLVRRFPNLLFAQDANLISNVPHNIVDSARTIAVTVRHAVDNGFAAVEPSQEAENAWVELLQSGPASMIGGPDCTPGYYNNEGQDSGAFLGRGYPHGPGAYFAYSDRWRASGTFDGLEFRQRRRPQAVAGSSSRLFPVYDAGLAWEARMRSSVRSATDRPVVLTAPNPIRRPDCAGTAW